MFGKKLNCIIIILIFFILYINFIFCQSIFCQTWQPMGPYGGEFSAIEIAESNPNIMYAGTYYGGLYKSVNSGKNWQYIGFKGNTITKIAIDSSTSENVYISRRAYDQLSEHGTLRSNDGGKTWDEISLESRTVATSSKISDLIFVGNNDGLFKSTDGGNSFKKIDYEFGLNNISVIISDPINSDIWFLGTDNTVYKSQDSGENWVKLRDFFESYGPYGLSITSIAISPINNLKVIVSTRYGGIFISDNGGGTWENTGWGYQVHAVLCDDQDEDIIYAGHLDGFMKSRREQKGQKGDGSKKGTVLFFSL